MEWVDKIMKEIFEEAKKKMEAENKMPQIHVLTDRKILFNTIKKEAMRCRSRGYNYTQYLLFMGTEIIVNLGIVGAELVIQNWYEDIKKAWRDTK